MQGESSLSGVRDRKRPAPSDVLQGAADRAARDCLPSAADIANMTVPQLKTVCKALNIKPMPSTKDGLRNAVNGYVTAGDDADVVVPISAA